MAKGPFKMKANPEGPMRKNFPSVFKNNKKKSFQAIRVQF